MSSTAKPKLAIGKVRKARITRRRLVHHWGQPHFVTPAYIPAFLGDGGMLLALQPLDTRPKFYLIRVDSSWSTSNFDETCVCDHLDEIYDAIEDWFGAEEWEDDHGRTRRDPWPAFAFGSGQGWWDATYQIKAGKKG